VGRRLLANVEAAWRRSTDPLERLRDLLARHMGMIRENLALPRAVFSEDVYGAHPRRKTLARKMIQGYLARVARVVRQGQREGGIRRDLDPDAAAILFLGMIQPAAILWHMTDGDFDVAGHARKVWRIFGRAIQQEPGRRRARRPRVISPPISRRRRSTSSISTRQGAA
jgi:AcrR family transcriptional regulator